MSALQRWLSGLSGRRIGTDATGNVYFESRRDYLDYGRKRRWVVFAGAAEASAVPPEWHGWLHHTVSAPIEGARRLPWQKPHLPNLTGTAEAWRPSPRARSTNPRPATMGDYEAWTPGS